MISPFIKRRKISKILFDLSIFLNAENDGWVADVTDIYFPAAYEGDAGRGSRGAGQTARSLRPLF